MIHIDRSPTPPPIGVYTEEKYKLVDKTMGTKAQREIEKAIVFFTDPAHYCSDRKITRKSFTFHVCKDSELAVALEKCFNRKCAYCESRFAHVTPKEIEHFRPKSAIDTDSKTLKPGYYWLATDWENLLVSCVDCNRARYHEVPGQDKKMKLGKQDQFPLSPGACHVRSHEDNIEQEEPFRILLNPCIDKPEDHLTFDEDGLIYPRGNDSDHLSEMGKCSIEVYALQRKGLVEERQRILKDLKFQIHQLSQLISGQMDLESMQAKLRSAGLVGTMALSQRAMERNKQQIIDVVSKLKSIMDIEAPYLAMLREYITRTKQSGEFDEFTRFKIDLEDLV